MKLKGSGDVLINLKSTLTELVKYANIHRVHEIKQTVHFILTICQQHLFQFNFKKEGERIITIDSKTN